MKRARLVLGLVIAVGCGQQLVTETVCTPGEAMCAGACSELASDNANCGACGKACSGGTTCLSGACVMTCGTGTILCAPDGGAAYCASAQSDNLNCGGCGHACAPTEQCRQGACGPACAATSTACSGQCVDVATDPRNCGACGVACIGGCASGSCVRATAISARGARTCAMLEDKSFWCWGAGGLYALGNGSTLDESEPVRVVGVTGTQLSSGWYESCAIVSQGIQCWGDFNGQHTASYVFGLSGYNIQSVSVGNGEGCAVLDGVVFCWGTNTNGSLGDGSYTESFVTNAVKVQNLTSAFEVAVGFGHACAIWGQSGTVSCWGNNGSGQLGIGQSDFNWNPTPVDVPNLSGVKHIAAAGGSTCAVMADDTVECWGLVGTSGSPFVNSPSPTPVPSLSAVTVLSGGFDHYCAASGGKVTCFGDDTSGQLGDSSVTALQNVVSATAGDQHSCALIADGTVWCWGDNARGQLGDGTKTSSLSAVRVR